MAFPGTYNFNYYRGDTYQFRIRPKDAAGNVFTLNNYSAAFLVADRRGPAPSGGTRTAIACTATIDIVQNYITCTITPEDGRQLTTGKTWYYDVQISTGNGTVIYTLLTGQITVQDDIILPTDVEEES